MAQKIVVTKQDGSEKEYFDQGGKLDCYWSTAGNIDSVKPDGIGYLMIRNDRTGDELDRFRRDEIIDVRSE